MFRTAQPIDSRLHQACLPSVSFPYGVPSTNTLFFHPGLAASWKTAGWFCA